MRVVELLRRGDQGGQGGAGPLVAEAEGKEGGNAGEEWAKRLPKTLPPIPRLVETYLSPLSPLRTSASPNTASTSTATGAKGTPWVEGETDGFVKLCELYARWYVGGAEGEFVREMLKRREGEGEVKGRVPPLDPRLREAGRKLAREMEGELGREVVGRVWRGGEECEGVKRG